MWVWRLSCSIYFIGFLVVSWIPWKCKSFPSLILYIFNSVLCILSVSLLIYCLQTVFPGVDVDDDWIYNIPETKRKYVSFSVQSRANLLCKGTRVCHDFIKWMQRSNDIVNNMKTLHFLDLNSYKEVIIFYKIYIHFNGFFLDFGAVRVYCSFSVTTHCFLSSHQLLSGNCIHQHTATSTMETRLLVMTPQWAP